MDGIVIGKRIPLGAIVGGVVGALIWAWNATHVIQIPAGVGIGVSTAIVGVAQLIIVRYFGVTAPKDPPA